jgi:formamidase
VRVGPENGHNRWHPDIEPVAWVRPGEIVTLATRDGLAGQLTRDSTHEDCGRLSPGAAHPLTGPIHIDSAAPGDILSVEILSYETADFGVSCLIPGFGFLTDLFPDPYLLKWEIADGLATSDALPGVAVPAGVHAGVLGVAPSDALMEEQRAREEAIRKAGGPVADPAPDEASPASASSGLRTIPPRENGGNLDIRRLVAGSTLYLPVHVRGANFSAGDIHFSQGDGEVCGTGVEVEGEVTVRLDVIRAGTRHAPRFPSYKIPASPWGRDFFATTGVAENNPMDITEAARSALIAMIDWLEADHGLTRQAAYCLCSACVDLSLSQVVDLPSPLVSALCPLDVFL